MLVKIKAFFKLIRWFHEIVVILPFFALFNVIDFFALKTGINCNLSGFNFTILCLCVQLLIAAGCVLNDIIDRNIDKINKPKSHVIDNTTSLIHSKLIFLAISILIVLLTAYISYYVFTEWVYISFTVYLLSILSNVFFKRTPLLGNIVIAALTAFIPLVLFFFAKGCIEKLHNEKVNLLIYLYAGFPFLIIIARELSLDISDLEGDQADGCKTLPIVIGIKKSKLIVAFVLMFLILLSVPVALRFRHLVIYFILVDVLLLFYLYKLKNVETRIDYIKIGRFLWFIMIAGLAGFTIATVI